MLFSKGSLDSLSAMLDKESIEKEILEWAYRKLKEEYGVTTDEEVRALWQERGVI